MWLRILVLCWLAGSIGAYYSMKSVQGWSAWWPFAAGILAIGVWAWMTKQPALEVLLSNGSSFVPESKAS